MLECLNVKMLKRGGFTLVEIIVVILIMVILFGIVVANYHLFGYQFALQRSANKLAQDIRRAQEMAMSSKECPASTSCAGQVPRGYGIYIAASDSAYLIYADLGGNAYYNPGVDAVMETTQLEKGITISAVSTSPGKANINFTPPDPTINIKWDNGQEEASGLVTITLAIKTDLSRKKEITANKAGLIEVK